MKQLPRMRFVFDRRGNATLEKQANVELEIYFNRKERKFLPTGISLYADQWSSEVVNHVDGVTLNKQLDAFKLKYERTLSAMQVDGIAFNLENFNARIGVSKKQGTQEYSSFIDFMHDRIAKRDLRESTRRMHIVTLDALCRFGKIKSFESLTPKNINLFDDFLREENPHRMQTTIHGYHRRIKPYVTDAINLEYITSNPYNLFKNDRGTSKKRDPLTQSELDHLRTVGLNDKLSRVRDVFVFACYTGLSYSDICLFRPERDIVESNGMHYIDGERLKTGTKYYTPLLRPAMDVLQKYDNKLPRISMQKYNDYLHVIEAKLELRKPLTSHVARHTFATTVTLANDVPIETVSRMLGHKDIKTTQIYAKILKTTIERHTEALARII